MDSIECILGISPFVKGIEHLNVYINGIRLDELITEISGQDFIGLIPSLLNFYDEDFIPSKKEKKYVWEQTKLNGTTKELPILLSPDDFDFSCTVVVVEVIDKEDKVIWNRFGMDLTEFDQKEDTLPKYIGKKVDWFPNIGPFTFCKNEYSECIEKFWVLNNK